MKALGAASAVTVAMNAKVYSCLWCMDDWEFGGERTSGARCAGVNACVELTLQRCISPDNYSAECSGAASHEKARARRGCDCAGFRMQVRTLLLAVFPLMT